MMNVFPPVVKRTPAKAQPVARALAKCLGLFLSVFLLAPAVARSQEGGGKRPNILWIMSDDHAAHAIGAYGGRLKDVVPTANLDRLAAEGMVFDAAFCTNSICTPSRATLMTGQYSQANGVLDLNGSLPAEKQYLPKLMKEAGYQTAMIGKWHLKEEPAFYDYYCVFPGQGNYFNPMMREKGKGEWPKNEQHFAGYDSKHSSDAVADISLKWLAKRKKDQPFFLMHHFKAPHDNFENAERFDFFLDDVEIPEPESLWKEPNYGSDATRGTGTSVGKRNTRRNMGHHMFVDSELPDDEYKHVAYQRYLKKYLRTVAGVDENLGRLLAYLEEEGIMDDTIILYTSDQGFMLGEHDYIDKRWMYEESMTIPFIVRYPAWIKEGSRTDALINNTDFAPTLLDIAGVPTPDYMHGRSVVPILKGETPQDWRTSTYYRYWMHMAHHDNPAHIGVRTPDYKLIFFYGMDYRTEGRNIYDPTTVGWELYDLRKDPNEINNVYGQTDYQEITQELKAEMKRLREEYGETDEAYPHLKQRIEEGWDE